MHFLWGVLAAYLLIILLGAVGKVEVRFKTGPPKPKPQPPPKPRREKPERPTTHPYEGMRFEVLREGKSLFMVTSKNGQVTHKIICPKDADDWQRTARATANLMGLEKVGEWAWEWRGEKQKPPGCYTTYYNYDKNGNLIGQETVHHS